MLKKKPRKNNYEDVIPRPHHNYEMLLLRAGIPILGNDKLKYAHSGFWTDRFIASPDS